MCAILLLIPTKKWQNDLTQSEEYNPVKELVIFSFTFWLIFTRLIYHQGACKN